MAAKTGVARCRSRGLIRIPQLCDYLTMWFLKHTFTVPPGRVWPETPCQEEDITHFPEKAYGAKKHVVKCILILLLLLSPYRYRAKITSTYTVPQIFIYYLYYLFIVQQGKRGTSTKDSMHKESPGDFFFFYLYFAKKTTIKDQYFGCSRHQEKALKEPQILSSKILICTAPY